MHQRPLGRTGLTVSPLTFGGAPLGGMYGAADDAACVAAVHAAIDQGLNLIDTSPYYGPLLSEEVLGRALSGGWRQRVLLSTKAGRYALDDFDFSPARMASSLDESLRRLGTDHVDLFFAHDIEFAVDLEAVLNETVAAMQRLKSQGKCRLVGVSGYPLPVLARAVAEAELDVVLSYCHFTLLNTQLVTHLLPLAERRGVALLNASPLSMGLLTQAGPPTWHPAPPTIKSAARRAADHCRARGADLADLALRFALQEERLPTTLVGMARAEEVTANLRALDAPLDLTLLAEVEAILTPVKDQGWPSGRLHPPKQSKV